jgi:hypothetical protein
MSVFWFTWLASLLHAVIRSRPAADGGASPAWGDQCWAAAGLAVAAVLANWITTGDHLLATVGEGYWPVAGVDLVLLTGAGAAAWTAYRLGRKAAAAQAREAFPASASTGQPAHV